MNRMVLGAFIALALAGLGLFWWQGPAAVEAGAPPPIAAPATPDPEALPIAEASDLRGPAPPEATELTRDEQRFFRYDRNRDRKITRNEMLSTRSAGFRKLDTDGNNLLDFEEWAIATGKRFEGSDVNGNGEVDLTEFVRTAPRPARRAANCRC